MNDNYDDIINMPRHISTNRPHMSLYARASQFSAFAALNGYDDAIAETTEFTESKIELSDNELDIINAKIQILSEQAEEMPEISVTYFVPNVKKNGGTYMSVTGNIKKIDEYKKQIIFTNNLKIPINDVSNISGAIFKQLDYKY